MNQLRLCDKNRDLFCFICGLFTTQKQSCDISPKLNDRFEYHFESNIFTHEFSPNIICVTCRRKLYSNERFMSKPMKWNSPVNHPEDCYFCLTGTD